MNFLKANKDNLNEIMLLYKEVIKTTFTTWGEDYPSRELIKSDIDNGNIYIVIEDNKIIAVSFLGVKEEENEEWVNNLNNPLGIARICVKKEYQGKGIGSEFLRFLISAAKLRGADGMHFHVATLNGAAMNMYEKAGFKNCGRGKSNYGFDYYKYEMVFK